MLLLSLNIFFALIFLTLLTNQQFKKNFYTKLSLRLFCILGENSTIQKILQYSYDLSSQKASLIGQLTSDLNLPKDINLEQLTEFVAEQDYQSLLAYISDAKLLLNESKKFFPNYKLFARYIENLNHPLSITFNLPGDIERIFKITVTFTSSDFATLSGFTVWFNDLGEDVRKLANMKFEIERLQAECSKLSYIINQAPFPIWQRDQNLNIIFFNPAYGNLINRDIDQAIEKNSYMIELDKNSRDFAVQASENNKFYSEEKYIITQGKRHLYNITEVPNNQQGTIGYGQDVTAKDQIKQELDRHIYAQSDLLEGSASAMAIYGPDTKLKFFNQAFIKLWNLDEKWLANQPTYGQILEALRERRKLPEQANFPDFKKKQLKIFTDLISPHNEFLYLPDGRSLRVLVIPHALGGLLFAYEDMTSRLALERSYNTALAVQKATLDNLHEGVVVFGQNGRLKLSNPCYAILWGMSAEFLASEPHLSELIELNKNYFHENKWEDYLKEMIYNLANRTSSIRVLERTDGKVLSRCCVPLPDGAMLVTYIDITDSSLVERSLRMVNSALHEADRLKTEFLANISYELRSPLTSIMGLSESLNKQYFGELNKKQKEYTEGIYNSSLHLMNLINDILDLSSIEAGYFELDIAHFDLNKMAKSIVPLIKGRVKKAKLHFEMVSSLNSHQILGDEKRIKQVIFKLLSNAIEYNKEGGRIKLSLSDYNESNVAIIVEDTGVGLDQEEQKIVFNKFYRNQAIRYKKAGTGLGLPLVENFIKLHGGHITLESEKDQFTRVICVIPKENQDLIRQMSTADNIELVSELT